MNNPFASSFHGTHKEVSSVTQPDTSDFDPDSYLKTDSQSSSTAIALTTDASSNPPSKRKPVPETAPLDPSKVRYIPPAGIDLRQIASQDQLRKQPFAVILFNVACMTTTTIIPVEVAAVKFTLGSDPSKLKSDKGNHYHSIIKVNSPKDDDVINRNIMTAYWNMNNVHGLPNAGGISNERVPECEMTAVWENLRGLIGPDAVIVGKQPTVTYRCLEKISSKGCKFPAVRPVEDVVECICNVLDVQNCDYCLDRIDSVPLQPQDKGCMCKYHEILAEKGKYRCVLAEAFKLVSIINNFYIEESDKMHYRLQHDYSRGRF